VKTRDCACFRQRSLMHIGRSRERAGKFPVKSHMIRKYALSLLATLAMSSPRAQS
jgi:hypothetical protein